MPWSEFSECWALSQLFHSPLSLSSRGFFSSSSLSAIRVVSSAYLRLLVFLPAILIPSYASSSLAFLMMYSAYKLNKLGDNIQPWHTPFPIWNQSVVPCPVLTVASWPAYRFLKRQVRWSGMPNSFRIFQFIVIYTIKGFGIVNKAEIDVFLELSCFFMFQRIKVSQKQCLVWFLKGEQSFFFFFYVKTGEWHLIVRSFSIQLSLLYSFLRKKKRPSEQEHIKHCFQYRGH